MITTKYRRGLRQAGHHRPSRSTRSPGRGITRTVTCAAPRLLRRRLRDRPGRGRRLTDSSTQGWAESRAGATTSRCRSGSDPLDLVHRAGAGSSTTSARSTRGGSDVTSSPPEPHLVRRARRPPRRQPGGDPGRLARRHRQVRARQRCRPASGCSTGRRGAARPGAPRPAYDAALDADRPSRGRPAPPIEAPPRPRRAQPRTHAGPWCRRTPHSDATYGHRRNRAARRGAAWLLAGRSRSSPRRAGGGRRVGCTAPHRRRRCADAREQAPPPPSGRRRRCFVLRLPAPRRPTSSGAKLPDRPATARST